MRSPIVTSIARLVFPFVLAFALYLLLRGHIGPGGGFIAGVMVAAAFCLQYASFPLRDLRRLLRVDFRLVLAAGLLMAASGGIGAMALGLPFLTSGFEHFYLPILGDFEVSSAIVFDTGVFLVVVGAILTMITSVMMEGSPWKP